MNANHNTMKNLVTGLILGGLSLAGLSAVGCNEQQVKEALGLTSGAPVASSAQASDTEKDAGAMRRVPIFTNHNETFLADAAA